jgi:hypothetical protein
VKSRPENAGHEKPIVKRKTSCVKRRLRNRRDGRTQNGLTTLELRENGAPGGLDGALKMDRLHAQQGESLAAGEQASGARASGEAHVFLKGATQPSFFVGIEFGKGHEIAVKDVFGFGAKDVRQAAGHAGTEIEAEGAENDGDAAGHVLAAVLADAFDHG